MTNVTEIDALTDELTQLNQKSRLTSRCLILRSMNAVHRFRSNICKLFQSINRRSIKVILTMRSKAHSHKMLFMNIIE